MSTLYPHNIWEGVLVSEGGADSEGWNGAHQGMLDMAVLSARRATAAGMRAVIVDVGVWKGQSTIHLAKALQSAGIDGCVLAVDTFLGSFEHWNNPACPLDRVHGFPDLYRLFLSNVRRAGVEDYVVPIPQTSTTAAAILRRYEITASMVHIDAAHEYADVLRDAQEYWSLIQPGGALIGDDYDPYWAGVVKAADEFSSSVNTPLQIDYPKWILRKEPCE
jgi:hypothetical protein